MATAWTTHVYSNRTLFLIGGTTEFLVSAGRRQSYGQMVFGFLSQILVSA